MMLILQIITDYHFIVNSKKICGNPPNPCYLWSI